MALTVTALTVTTFVSPAAARQPINGATATPLTPTAMMHGNKSMSGRLAQSDKDLLARTDSTRVNVMVKLDIDPVASYPGGLIGMSATSPYATGQSLKDNAVAVSAYGRYLAVKANIARAAALSVIPGIKLGGTFLVAYGGFAAQ